MTRAPQGDAFAWAQAVIDARGALCERLSSGEADLHEVLGDRTPPEDEAHLLVVLEALPDASKVGTRRRLAALGIAERTKLADLTGTEVRRILAEFGPPGAPSADLGSGGDGSGGDGAGGDPPIDAPAGGAPTAGGAER